MVASVPYGQILSALAWMIVLTGMGAGFLGMGYYFQMRAHRTSAASVLVRQFVPWWPWIDGMLAPEGIGYRRKYGRSIVTFLCCWALGAAVLGAPR